MEYKFTRSVVVMEQLARKSCRTPPSEENSPFEYIDRSLTILGRTFDVHSEQLRIEFLAQREFMANESKKVDKKFEDLEEKMDRRFKEVDKKIDGVNNNMRDHLNHIHKASLNSLRTRGWEEIYPVGSLESHGGFQTPRYFPRNVRHFWRLKDPPRLYRLVYLIRFYCIQGYEEWGRDADSFEGYSDPNDSSEDTSESSGSPMPIHIEDAVQSHPEMAHRALGAHLRLAYDEIQRFMERAKDLSQRQVIGNKRELDNQASEKRKRPAFKLSDMTEVTSPTEPRSSQGRTR